MKDPIRTYLRQFLVLLFLLTSVLQTFAFWNFPVKNYPRSQYNSGTQNWDIIQHKNGWMYFANNHGLLEFDGLKWINYPVSNASNVHSLAIGDDGRIYAGAYREFGYFEDNDLGRLQYTSLSDMLTGDSRRFDIIWNIFSINKAIYFCSDNNKIIQWKDDKLTIIPTPGNVLFSGETNQSLYISTKNGIFFLVAGKWRKLPNTEKIASLRVLGISQLPDSRLLIFTSKDGFYRYRNGASEKWTTQADRFLQENDSYCMSFSDSQIAIGTVKNGVVLMDYSGKNCRYINRLSGLQNNTILAVGFDNNENLWLGLDSGIDYIATTSPLTDLYGTSNFYGAGYTSLIQGNFLYLGTNQGLFATKWPVVMTEKPIELTALSITGQIWKLKQIGGEVFCGSNEGISILKGDAVERVSAINGAWNFMEWDENTILVGTYTGFAVLKKENGHWFLSHHIPGFTESSRIMEWDTDHSLWMSHGNLGVFHIYFDKSLDTILEKNFYGKKEGLPDNLNNSVYTVDGNIVFTTMKGTYRYNRTDDGMEPLKSLNQKLGSDGFYTTLQEDGSENIWFAANDAVGVVSEDEKGEKTREYGLFQNNLIGGFEHILPVETSGVILGYENGFAWVDTRQLLTKSPALSLTIRSVYATIPQDSLVYGRNYRSFDRKIILPFEQNSIRIELATFGDILSDVQYAYQLEGSNNEKWSDWSNSSIKEFSNLQEGDYLLRVKAKVGEDKTETNTELQFTISPPWYRSVTAYIIYFLLFLAVAFIIVRAITKRIERNRERLLSEQKKEISQKEEEIITLKNEKLEYQLLMKNQQLANSAMNLIRKNEILQELREDVSKICSSNKELAGIKQRLHVLCGKINENIEHDNDWLQFEENFDLVHSNFLRRLGEVYPQLNLGNKKLCAYLKMNLTSKEIAPLLNISVRGVEIGRYRLRKKLNLQRDENLSDFLQNF